MCACGYTNANFFLNDTSLLPGKNARKVYFSKEFILENGGMDRKRPWPPLGSSFYHPMLDTWPNLQVATVPAKSLPDLFLGHQQCGSPLQEKLPELRRRIRVIWERDPRLWDTWRVTRVGVDAGAVSTGTPVS